MVTLSEGVLPVSHGIGWVPDSQYQATNPRVCVGQAHLPLVLVDERTVTHTTELALTRGMSGDVPSVSQITHIRWDVTNRCYKQSLCLSSLFDRQWRNCPSHTLTQ